VTVTGVGSLKSKPQIKRKRESSENEERKKEGRLGQAVVKGQEQSATQG